ncbi:hypothetical protein ABT093_18275 [Kitasatospora sp. NPDC002551]|uniref:hypothetical protein n=1 Tax=Kitasatospora sp. NPDC002551 TaxID=3154539 RepID=UPI0033278B8A
MSRTTMSKWSIRATSAPPAQVVALDEPLGAVDRVEELDREAERVHHAHRVADAARAGAGRHPAHRAAERGEELLGAVHVPGGAHPVGEVVQGGRLARAQHQAVVGQLVGAAQVQRAVVLVLDVEARHVDPIRRTAAR